LVADKVVFFSGSDYTFLVIDMGCNYQPCPPIWFRGMGI